MRSSVLYRTDLNALGLLQVSGAQSVEFLQGQLSCHLAEVTPTASRLGAHCNAQGRVLATFRIFYRAPYYYLLLPHAMAPFLFKDLSKYAPFYKVSVEDVSLSFQKVGLTGSSLAGENTAFPFAPIEKNAVYSDKNTIRLVIPGKVPRMIILSTTPVTLDQVITKTKPFSYWESTDILSGIASIYPKTRALFTPHHLNYQHQEGVSFTKGCYTGQEVIARMHYLGKLKQQLCQLTLNSMADFMPATDIVDQEGTIKGTLLMSAVRTEKSSGSTYKALAVIQTPEKAGQLYVNDHAIQKVRQIKSSDYQ